MDNMSEKGDVIDMADIVLQHPQNEKKTGAGRLGNDPSLPGQAVSYGHNQPPPVTAATKNGQLPQLQRQQHAVDRHSSSASQTQLVHADDNNSKSAAAAAGDDDAPVPSSSSSLTVVLVSKLFASLVLGFVFGVAMEKTRVFEPQSIRLQMVFEKWIMVKMFLAALASSLLSLSILSLLPVTRRKFRHATVEYTACLTRKGVLASGLGPFVLGMGMTLAGACPGMVLPQVGAWAPNAIFTFAGCMLGALMHGLVAPSLDKLLGPAEPYQHHLIHEKFQKPFAVFAVPLGLCVGVVVALLEVFIDYRDDLERPDKLSYNIARTIAWPPYVGGILIGVLQLPMVLLLEDTIGGSSSYVTVISQWVITKGLKTRFPYLAAKRTGLGNWWQVLYVGGAIIGGLSSAAASRSLASVPGVGVVEAICGGILMLLGARIAGGCTSGHGISGVSLLAWLSFLAVPFMFAGAIVTAFVMRAADNSLERFVNSTLSL